MATTAPPLTDYQADQLARLREIVALVDRENGMCISHASPGRHVIADVWRELESLGYVEIIQPPENPTAVYVRPIQGADDADD